jgi:hypothetical protein
MATEVKNEVITLDSAVKQLVRLQVEVVALPFNLLPPEPRRYAVDAVRQAFKAVRAVVDELSDTIDSALLRNTGRGDEVK